MSITTDRTQRPVVKSQGRLKFDIATILGLISGFGLLGTALIFGGAPESFFDVPSILIVFGGTTAIVVTSFGPLRTMRAIKVTSGIFLRTVSEPKEAAEACMILAKTARKQGTLALQNHLTQVSKDSLLRQGIEMVVDGFSPEEIERLLINEMTSRNAQQIDGSNVLRRASEISPAMGLIGTLVGLVQMLGNLEDPSSIGPAMAIALLTTFYGVILSNMVFAPLASKLEHNANDDILVGRIYTMTALSIIRQENPRRLEMLINSFLPPSKRLYNFENR